MRRVEVVLHYARGGYIKYFDLYLSKNSAGRKSIRSLPRTEKMVASFYNLAFFADAMLSLLQRIGKTVGRTVYGRSGPTVGETYEISDEAAPAFERLIRLRNTAREREDWRRLNEYVGQLVSARSVEDLAALVGEVTAE